VKRWLALAAAAVAVLSVGSASALAVAVPGTLDQHQDTATDANATWVNNGELGQIFTAGSTGDLVAFGVYAGAVPVEVPNVKAALPTQATVHNAAYVIASIASGDPSTFLYSGFGANAPGGVDWTEIDLPSTPGWVYFILPVSIPVTSGTQYAILLDADLNPATALTWAGVCASDPYAGGKAVIQDWTNYPAQPVSWQTVTSWGSSHETAAACQQDFAFRTYIATGATPPPTGTLAPAKPAGQSPVPTLLVFASVAAAGAFVAMRKLSPIRR
jgi:hypothetical protein